MTMELDLLIKEARIYDGSGNSWFRADIGISQGKIATIGKLALKADRTINATGLSLCPGFVDLHNHNDLVALAYPNLESHLMQGITTSVTGNCGLTMAPVHKNNLDLLKNYLSPFLKPDFDYGWDWTTNLQYFRKVEQQGISSNLAPLIGQGTIRIAVKGFDSTEASPGEMSEMKKLLKQSLEDGILGMSSGLFYPPGSYSSTEELVDLASVLTDYNALFSIHLRNESDKLIESVDEAITVAERNGIPLQISHHKAAGRANWGKIRGSLKIIEQARKRGVEVNCDVYPYIAGSTMISSLLPTWALEGGIANMLRRLNDRESRNKIEKEISEGTMEGENWIKSIGWNNIVIGGCPSAKQYEGKSLEEIIGGKESNLSSYQTFFDWLLEISGDAIMLLFGMDEDDVRTVITHPVSTIITDAWATTPDGGGKPHPRAYGTFPRVFKKYVRDEKILTIEEAIRKMTSLPASKIGLRNRGLIRENCWADLLLFNEDTIADKATFSDPHQYPEGIKAIIVNGQIVVEDGKLTGNRSGRVLLRENN